MMRSFRERLAKVPVLLVPLAGHAGYEAPVFPQGTLEVLQFLQDGLPSDVQVDITVEDADYEELTLHAAAIIIPTLLLKAWAGGIVLNIISSYLYDLLKDAAARCETRTRARLLVETSTRTLSLEYDGPAEQLPEIVRAAFEREVPPAERSLPAGTSPEHAAPLPASAAPLLQAPPASSHAPHTSLQPEAARLAEPIDLGGKAPEKARES
jgi:hypothetical protein